MLCQTRPLCRLLANRCNQQSPQVIKEEEKLCALCVLLFLSESGFLFALGRTLRTLRLVAFGRARFSFGGLGFDRFLSTNSSRFRAPSSLLCPLVLSPGFRG